MSFAIWDMWKDKTTQSKQKDSWATQLIKMIKIFCKCIEIAGTIQQGKKITYPYPLKSLNQGLPHNHLLSMLHIVTLDKEDIHQIYSSCFSLSRLLLLMCKFHTLWGLNNTHVNDIPGKWQFNVQKGLIHLFCPPCWRPVRVTG